MNILPKKRWHVRTKDNIARVRRDEAAAREEEHKKQEKLKLAESEARINFLLKRSGLPEKSHIKVDEKRAVNEDAGTSQHFDLFADYKSHVKATNKELEKEKKEEQEKYEKKIGYLTYLGQDTNEVLRLKSWYEIPPKRIADGSERIEQSEKDLKIKHNHDPLTLIKAILPFDPKSTVNSTTLKRRRSRSPVLAEDEKSHEKSSKKNKKGCKKHKRSKELKHSKKKSKKEKIKEDEIQKRLKIEKLRKERLYRENKERARQETLLNPKDSVKDRVTEAPKIVQKYNSQFNPELAKQNINK